MLNHYTGKTILITGASGYLATSLINSLKTIDCKIVRLSRKNKLGPITGNARIVDIAGDIRTKEIIEKALKQHIDVIFHLAAYEHNHGSEFNPILDLEINTLAILHLLEVCRLKKYVPRIVFASSSNLVGLPAQLPVNETCQDNPSTIFALHKLFSEKYLQYYAREFGQHSIVLRLANVYGPVCNMQASVGVVLNRLIDRALKGEKLFLYRNGDCIRDYVWIDDVVAAFHAAACLGNQYATGQHYLIGSGSGYQISEVMTMIADKVAQRTGQKTAIEKDANERLEAIEWRNFVADTGAFNEATGWKAIISIDEGIDRTIDFFLRAKKTL
jgi:nucleoside-diphosphate-sugar epimerase